MSLEKEPGDCIARMGERAAEGGSWSGSLDPRGLTSLRAQHRLDHRFLETAPIGGIPAKREGHHIPLR